ncbi:hypothetical protein BDW02DRAFT_469775, partial [Decorospora gaudefroyi]
PSQTRTSNMSTGSEQLDALPHLNAKQRSRIQKRRLARQKLQEVLALKKSRVLPPQPNNHPSGCMRPPRGPDGRFLTPEQIATKELEK